MKARKSSQLFVSTKDEPGELAKVLGIVSGAGVNILAYVGWGEGANGQVMLITQDNAKVAPLLRKAGFENNEVPVVLVEDKDVVGSGSIIAKKAAAAGVNLRSAFATCIGGSYLTVLASDDTDKLVATLQK